MESGNNVQKNTIKDKMTTLSYNFEHALYNWEPNIGDLVTLEWHQCEVLTMDHLCASLLHVQYQVPFVMIVNIQSSSQK